jgi:Metallo-peptidase family M12
LIFAALYPRPRSRVPKASVRAPRLPGKSRLPRSVARLHGRSLILGCAIAGFAAAPLLGQPAADEKSKIVIDETTRAQVRLTPEQQAVLEKISRSPEMVNLSVLRGSARARAEQDGYARFTLPLDGGKEVVLVRTQPTVKTERGFTWRGEDASTGERAVLMLWDDGHLSGFFGHEGRVFMVSHVGGEIHSMAEIDPGKMPPDHAPTAQSKPAGGDASTAPPPEPEVAPFAEAERSALEAKSVTIDVMLLYTKNAAANYIGDPADLLELAIEQANDTFRNSALGNIKLRLVHTGMVDYDESDLDHFTHLYRLVDGQGVFKDVRKLRDAKRADIVGLVLHSPTGCGLSTRVGADADEAYFVVHHACAAITYSLAHEVGHILGTRHDRAADRNEKPFAYAHGHVNGDKWRDMMSYRETCGGCPRIPFWSNPRVLYRGEPTGTAASDNARLILEQAERVSGFR